MSKFPTVVWSGVKLQRWWCFENRDNLFWEPEKKSMSACGTQPTHCVAKAFREKHLRITTTQNIVYTLVVKCNTTVARIYYSMNG